MQKSGITSGKHSAKTKNMFCKTKHHPWKRLCENNTSFMEKKNLYKINTICGKDSAKINPQLWK
jgi:hypothetical protein